MDIASRDHQIAVENAPSLPSMIGNAVSRGWRSIGKSQCLWSRKGGGWSPSRDAEVEKSWRWMSVGCRMWGCMNAATASREFVTLGRRSNNSAWNAMRLAHVCSR